ncbi:MAG: hypothetical protein V7754_15920 [Halioglobus sp.]
MKMFRRVTIGMVLAGVAGPAMATTVDRDHLAQCKSALKSVYGDESRMKLKSIRRSRKGDQMRIQAIEQGGESHITTCWVDRDGEANVLDQDGVALVEPVPDTQNRVSMND